MERTSTPGPERMYSVSSASPPASPRAPSTNRPRTGSGDQTTTGRGGTGIPHRVNRGITPHGESDVAVACRPGNASPPLGTIKSDLPPLTLASPTHFLKSNTGHSCLLCFPGSLPRCCDCEARRLSLRHQQVSWRSATRRLRSPRSCTRRRSHSAPTTAASRATRPPRASARTAPLQPRRPLRPPSCRRLRRLLHPRCSRWSTSRGQPQLFLRPLTGWPSRRRRGRRSTGATAAGSAWGSRGSGAGAASCSAARTGTRTGTSAASTTSPSAGTPSPGRTPSCEPQRSLGSDLTSQIRGGRRMDGCTAYTDRGRSPRNLLSFPFLFPLQN
jgi:hypothetical protein